MMEAEQWHSLCRETSYLPNLEHVSLRKQANPHGKKYMDSSGLPRVGRVIPSSFRLPFVSILLALLKNHGKRSPTAV